MDRVDCFTLASPKSAILAVTLEVTRTLEDLQSRWITGGLCSWRYLIPRAMSSMREIWIKMSKILACIAVQCNLPLCAVAERGHFEYNQTSHRLHRAR